ncbi:MAG: TonB-dependent receptor [Cytophagaceae bacterium]|jgi:iron complex outermembrane receptor protein|nr:TonB-dependent receptor [Cytophagaceae bacterium]
MRIAWLYSSLLLAILSAFGQERCHLHLSGRVINAEDGSFIQGAKVSVGNRLVTSDIAGNYDFHDLCADTLLIECVYPGFKKLRYTIFLSESRLENINLHRDTCVMESVIVKGKKNKIELRRQQSISSEDLLRSQGLSLGEQLRSIEGVTVVQTGPTIFKPVIQGLYGQRVVMMNNGIRQESQQWGSEHAPEIDPFVFDRISIIKGAASVRYGADALGGVILLDQNPYRKKDGLEGAIQTSAFDNNQMLSAAGKLEGRYKLISGRLQASTRQAGDSRTPSYVLSNTGFQEYNFSYGLAVQKRKWGLDFYYSQFNTKVGILSAAHIGNLTDLNRAIQNEKPLVIDSWTRSIERPYQLVAHELLKAQAFARVSTWLKVSSYYALQYNDRKEFDKHRPYNDELASKNLPELDMRISTHQAQVLAEHNFHTEHYGTLGVFYAQQSNASLGRPFIPNFKSTTLAVFATEAWQHKRWQAEIGARAERKFIQVFYYRRNELQTPDHLFQNVAIHLGGNYELRPHLKLYGNLSTGFRPPHVSELYSNGVHHGTASVELGDSTLVPEKAYSASLSLPFHTKKIKGEILVYQNYIQDFIYLRPIFPSTLTIRGAFPTFAYTQHHARFTGCDVSIQDTVRARWVLKGKGSVVNSRLVPEREVIFLSPPARAEAELRFLMGKKKLNYPAYAQASVQKTFRKTEVSASQDYAAAPDGYWLLHLEAGFTRNKEKVSLWWSAGINNVLNTRYRDYLDRFRYFADATGRVIYLKCRIYFNQQSNHVSL